MSGITRADVEALVAHAQRSGLKPGADGRYDLLVPRRFAADLAAVVGLDAKVRIVPTPTMLTAGKVKP